MNKRIRNTPKCERPHRKRRRRLKALGRNWMLLICTALLIVSAWEFCVRLDAMYKPVKMFFDLAIGEGISFDTAMTYFDWSIFEPPLYLMLCALLSLIALFLSRRPIGSMLLIPFCGALALYGLTRESTFLIDLWRLVQPALLLMMTGFGIVNLFTYRTRRRHFLADTPDRQSVLPRHDAPRMTDAPRLSGVSYHISNAPELPKKTHKRPDHIA